MPALLAAPSTLVYALLVLAAAGAGFSTRKKSARNAALALIGLLALVATTDALVETPLEEADRRLRLMSEAAGRKDWSAAFEHVSNDFKFRSYDKKGLRDRLAAVVAQYQATVTIKPIEKDTVEYRPDGTIKVGFAARGDSPLAPDRPLPVYVEAVFGKDPDGAYRIRSIEVYDFIQRRTTLNVPGL